MKKYLIFVIIIFLCFGCVKSTDEISSSESTTTVIVNYLEAAYNSLEISNQITADLDLPLTMDGGVKVKWECDNHHYLSEHGYVFQPAYGSGNQTANLTATLSYGLNKMVKTFDVTILEAESLNLTTPVSYNFVNLSTEYLPINRQVNLYFEGENDIPYIDLSEFINMISGAIDLTLFDIVTLDNTYQIVSKSIEDVYEATFDFDNNTITANCYDFFEAFSSETETNFGEGLSVYDYSATASDSVIIDLGDYGFDIVTKDDLYLVPLAIANLCLSGSMYDIYFDEEEIYGVDTYQILAGDESILPIYNSPKNNETMSLDIKKANYSFMALSFDYFYGLKELKNIDTYYDILIDYQAEMLGGTDQEVYDAVFDFTLRLDEMHSWPIISGYYEDNYNVNIVYEDLRTRYRNYYTQYWNLGDYYETKQMLTYLDGNTIAVIYFDGFEEDTPALFLDCLEDIALKGTVNNIVIDLGNNGGGILGSMLQIMGYITETPIAISGLNPLDNGTYTISYESENDALTSVDWFILTSPVTYSAANLMACIAKDMGVAKVIGKRSGGGACSIKTLITPTGSVLQISSMGMLTNSTYSSIEYGIIPNIFMADITSEIELVNLVNSN